VSHPTETVENYTTSISGYNLDVSRAVFNGLTQVRPSRRFLPFLFPLVDGEVTDESVRRAGHGPRNDVGALVVYAGGESAGEVVVDVVSFDCDLDGVGDGEESYLHL
jgi:hypothetical protein